MFKAKRILVPVDFSRESEIALDWAVMMAKDSPDTTIELCHVVPEVFAPIGPEAVAFDYARMEAAEIKAAEEKLQKVQARIPQAIYTAYTVGKGRIAMEIERLCKEKAIDLIVMTTHGRRGLARFLQGSTTEEVARLAPCPVLVLHLNSVIRETVKAS